MKVSQRKTILITYLIFIILWTLRIVLLKPLIDANLDIWMRQIVNALLKLALWCGPAIYCINRYNPSISLRDMFSKGFSLRMLGIFTAGAVIWHLCTMLLTNGAIQIKPFHPSQLISQFFVVGITEELLFRGWFYNALRSTTTPWKANAISSALLVTSHYPSYFLSGTGILSIAYLSVVIFLLGLLFEYLFERSKNIMVPTIAHSIWDLLQLLTIGMP